MQYKGCERGKQWKGLYEAQVIFIECSMTGLQVLETVKSGILDIFVIDPT
jgi:hypothetical protein